MLGSLHKTKGVNTYSLSFEHVLLTSPGIAIHQNFHNDQEKFLKDKEDFWMINLGTLNTGTGLKGERSF